jgi:hypothetical protein
MAEKIIIAELDIDVNALIKSTQEVKNAIDVVKNQQKELTKSGETSSAQFVQNAADLKTLGSAYNSNLKALSESTQAQADQANALQLVTLALNTEVTSIKEARDQNSLLNKLRNETNATTVEGKAQIESLNKKLDENNNFIKENADNYLKQKINIGNYSDSVKEALGSLNPLNGGLAGFSQRAGEAGGVLPLLTNGLKTAALGIYGMVRASLAFLATPIGLVIAAIGLTLGLLVNYLKSTQSGIDAVTSVTRPLQALFQSLLGVLQNLGKALFDAFNNPKKTLNDLADFVKNNLINRFTAFSKILQGIINLDFKAVSDGVLQATTGVENVTDKIKNSAKETNKFIADALAKGKQIDELTKSIEKSEINLNKEREIANSKIKELDRITKDTSASFAERLKANKEQNDLADITAKKEQAIINLKIQRLKIEQSLNDTSREGNKELADLEATLETSKQKNIEEQLKGTRIIAQARKDEAAKEKQRDQEAEQRRSDALNNIVSRLEQEKAFFEEKNRFNNQNVSNLEILSLKEIEILKAKLKAKQITQLEFDTETLRLQNEIKLKQDEYDQAELDGLKVFNERKRALLNEIELQNAKTQEEKDALKLTQDFEKQILELENLNLTETEKYDLLLLLSEKFGNDLQALTDKATAVRMKATAEAQIQEIGYEKQKNEIKIGLAKQLQSLLIGLLGDSIGAQLASIALDAILEIAKVKIATSAAQAINTANGLALSVPTLGASEIAALRGNIALGVSSKIQQGGILASAAIATTGAVIKNSGKFEQGGIQEVGGQRHSAGGTNFIGSDGTRFEAEKGEGIGILNRNAFGAFMDFNNAFKSGNSTPSFMAGGGIITQGVSASNFPVNELARITSDLVSNLPRPVVDVKEILIKSNEVISVENMANF